MSFLLAGLGLCGLTSCLSEGLCVAARLCCCALGAGSGSGARISPRAAKGGYIIIIALSAIFALILYNYGDKISFLHDIPVIDSVCNPQGAAVSQCYGASAVLRISLALTIFFSLNTFTAFSANSFVGCWGIKITAWIVLVIGCFFIPTDAISKYAEASRVFSILFLLAMVIILIDAAYHIHEFLTEKMTAKDEQLSKQYESIGICQNLWKPLYLLLAGGAFIGSMVGIGILYKISANAPNGATCDNNKTFLSIHLISAVIYTAVSMTRCGGDRGFLTPSMVMAYCTWLVWSAISSSPDLSCNPIPPDSSDTGATIIGMIIAAASLCYTAFSASRSLPHMFDLSGKKQTAATAEESKPLASHSHTASGESPHAGDDADAEDVEEGTGHAKSYEKKEEKPASPAPYSVVDSLIFSAILVLASMYMAPVLTNWVMDPSDVTQSRASAGTMWVNMASQWATVLLYSWTLIAPHICTARDFS